MECLPPMNRRLHCLAALALVALAPAAPAQPTSLTEGFDNVAGLTASGWFLQNNSFMPSTAGQWQQGTAPRANFLNPPVNGSDGSFAMSFYDATGGGDTSGDTVNDW